MVVVGDLIGVVGNLGFQAGSHCHCQTIDVGRQETGLMLFQTISRLPGEVQPRELGITLFQYLDDAQALLVMFESAVRLHHLIHRSLACMAKRRVTQVMGQRNGLGEILIQAQATGDRASDLRHLQGMGQTCAEVVPLMIHKNLRLILQAPEGG